MKTWAFGAAIICGLALVACSSSGGGTGGGGSGTTSSTKATTVSSTHSTTSTTSTSTGSDPCAMPTDVSDCSSCSYKYVCEACVIATTGMGIDLFNGDFATACGCTAGATCATDCTGDAVCTDPTKTPGMTCNSCLNNKVMKGDTCIAKSQMACQGQPDCKAFLANVQQCFTLTDCAADTDCPSFAPKCTGGTCM